MIDDLQRQARYCQSTSPLYAALFAILTGICRAHDEGQDDVALKGFFEILGHCWQGRRFTAWFERPLLLAGAIHEQVLCGHAPELARFYATCGGQFDAAQAGALAGALQTALMKRHQAMAPFLSQPGIQTNESARGLTWLLPLLAHWRAADRPPLSLIELGCSAGLGLVADHYGYQVALPDDQLWTQKGAPSFALRVQGRGAARAGVDLTDMAALGKAVKTRTGCDLRPLDCADANQKRLLEALIWGDNAPRLERLRAAMATRTGTMLRFERGDMVDCVQQLAQSPAAYAPMICTFNTIASCYLDDAHYGRLRAAIAAAFHGPWADKDCLWIEFEMPRAGEALPNHARDGEVLIRVHERGAGSGLQTRYFGAAAAHPETITVF